MANEVAKKTTGLIVTDDKWECTYEVENGDTVHLTENSVKTFFTGKDTSVEEIRKFIALCNFNKLNPFLGECYLVPFGNTTNIVVSRGGYLKRAQISPNFNGMESGIIVLRDGKVVEEVGTFYLENDVLLGGWAKVYHKGHSYPMVVKVALDDYKKKDSPTWKNLPAQMINKVAESQALRKAFPAQLNGLYTKEEIENTDYEEVEVKKEQKQNKKIIEMSVVEEQTIETPQEELQFDE